MYFQYLRPGTSLRPATGSQGGSSGTAGPPGTAGGRPLTSTNILNQAVKPMTGQGRPLSGFVRPSTKSSRYAFFLLNTTALLYFFSCFLLTYVLCACRPATGSIEAAFQGNRPNTSRPVTSSGRFVRLGTASMISEPGGPFINVDKLNLRKVKRHITHT